jgi:hypothetical protein
MSWPDSGLLPTRSILEATSLNWGTEKLFTFALAVAQRASRYPGDVVLPKWIGKAFLTLYKYTVGLDSLSNGEGF